MKLLQEVMLILMGLFFVTQFGCGDGPSSSVPVEGTIKVSIKSIRSGAPTSSSNGMGKTAAFATITSARMVIEKIRFDSSVEDTLDFRFRKPFVQDLIGTTNLHKIETIQVPFGSYKKSTIKIDELGAEDGEVYTQNPELQNLSIRAEGYLTGNTTNTFVFTSDLDKDQEREFSPPLILDENSSSTNIVLTIDLDMWFTDSDGNPLDPNSPSNQSMIENNIKNSIEVFEDKDDDGEEDD